MPRTGRPPSWSPDQLTYLKEQCRTRSTHDVALEMGMNKATARYYLRKWGVPILTCRKKWTSEEDAKLRDLVVDHTTVELAALLECTEVAQVLHQHHLILYSYHLYRAFPEYQGHLRSAAMKLHHPVPQDISVRCQARKYRS